MQPVAYKIASLLGGYCYCTAARYLADSDGGYLKGREVRGLFLSPQPEQMQGAEVYLYNRDSFLEVADVMEGSCPNDCLSLYMGPTIQESDYTLLAFGQRVRSTVQDLVERLARFHWSPRHPCAYTITHPDHGGQVGLGAIAMRDPASFNLVYAEMNGELDTALSQRAAVTLFVGYENLLSEMGSAALTANLTMQTQGEFLDWIHDDNNCADIPANTVNHIRQIVKQQSVR